MHAGVLVGLGRERRGNLAPPEPWAVSLISWKRCGPKEDEAIEWSRRTWEVCACGRRTLTSRTLPHLHEPHSKTRTPDPRFSFEHYFFSPLDTLFLLFLFNNKNKPLFVYLFTVGKNYLIPCWFCMFAHWQRNDQSIIFMFIWTVRDRITTTTKNIIQRSYKLICILMSEINIWPLRKTWLSTWWQNPCWQSQRSDVSCSWPPSLHTSQEGFCPTPLCRSSPSH